MRGRREKEKEKEKRGGSLSLILSAMATLLSSLFALCPPTPHSNFYICPASKSNLIDESTNKSVKGSILNLHLPERLSPSQLPLQSAGGGGILITPFTYLLGYTIEVSSSGAVRCLTSEDVQSFCLVSKLSYLLIKSRRLKPFVELKGNVRSACCPLAFPCGYRIKLALIPSKSPHANAINAVFRLDSSGEIGTTPSPRVLCDRLRAKGHTARFHPESVGGSTPKVLLASYPRSGNTMTRTLITSVTSIHTGSDSLPTRTLSWALSVRHNLPGEGVTDSRVEVVKTHWPERRGWWAGEGDRVILVVRNFYDAVESYWHMCMSNTHEKRCAEEVKKTWWTKWEAMVKNEAKIWRDFYDWWLERDASLLIVRFEDLIGEARHKELMRIAKFIGADDAKLDRSDDTQNIRGGYTVKSAGVGKSLHNGHFTPELIEYVESTCADMFARFGYSELSKSGRINPLPRPQLIRGVDRVVINEGLEIRAVDDECGRAITKWRKERTDDDRMPFKTVSR